MRSASASHFALAVLTAVPLLAQEGVPPPPGLVPEQVWYAPTAADWQKPVQIQWQRTWEDAVALSQATKKPILVCVNMDGEIASEHYAGVRYRDPEVGKLFEPYVCVIASVYRHNPRDYDEQGHRIPCPRLGCVTCGEHIALEPLVYEKFLKGKRISPRHIMVELDGSETYDVYFTWDVTSVLDTLKKGIADRAIQAPPVVKGDRSLVEKVASRDSADRSDVEQAFAAADPAERKRLLEAATALGENAPIELLRLAANGLDPDLATAARAAMTRTVDPGSVDLLADTLRAPLGAEERRALVQALGRWGESSTKARTFATAHQGLAGDKSALDVKRWQSALAGASYASAVAAPADLAGEATARDQALAAAPTDPNALLGVAEASLLQALATTGGPARGPLGGARARQLLLLDARRETEAAVAHGATGWRVHALRAVAMQEQGEVEAARAEALLAAPDLPPDAPGQLAMEVLALFASARQHAIIAAVRGKQPWPPEWTTDVHAAYAVLARHPLGRPEHVADHFDFLDFFNAPEADAVLQRGLERFPLAPALHARLRTRLLQKGGVAALDAEYARLLAAPDAAPALAWFAGYAALVTAETHRRNHDAAAALAAYARGEQLFTRYGEQSGADDGRHYAAMAHGGRARIRLEQDDLPACLDELKQAFALAPLAAAATDGLGVTAMQTADALRAKATGKDDALVAALDEALKQLPEGAFALPEYEQRTAPPRRNRRRN